MNKNSNGATTRESRRPLALLCVASAMLLWPCLLPVLPLVIELNLPSGSDGVRPDDIHTIWSVPEVICCPGLVVQRFSTTLRGDGNWPTNRPILPSLAQVDWKSFRRDIQRSEAPFSSTGDVDWRGRGCVDVRR